MYGRRVQEIEEEEELQRLREEWMKEEFEFIKKCEENGFKRVVIDSDGNCIFSSVSDQLYGRNHQKEIRKFVCDYMEIEKDYFRPFITHQNGILRYISEMREDGKWAGDIELQVLSEIYDVKIEVYSKNENPIKVFNENASQKHKVVRLLYLQQSHYDSLHKLSEDPTVIEGGFGTLESEVLDLARERVAKTKNGLNKGVQGDRTDYGRKSKFFEQFYLTLCSEE